MKRHPSLQGLSEDHHHGLVQARHLRRIGTDEAKLSPEETVRAFLRFWQEAGRLHFREEEEELLPFYARHGDPRRQEVVEMLLQHVEIRREAADLARALERREDLDLERIRALGERFDEHIRLEERVVFPLMEAAIPEEELVELAGRLRARG